MKKTRKQLILNLLSKKQIMKMIKMLLDIECIMEEVEIAKTNFIESKQKQADYENLPKSDWRIV